MKPLPQPSRRTFLLSASAAAISAALPAVAGVEALTVDGMPIEFDDRFFIANWRYVVRCCNLHIVSWCDEPEAIEWEQDEPAYRNLEDDDG